MVILRSGTTPCALLPPSTSSAVSDGCVPWLRQALKPLTSLIYRDEKRGVKTLVDELQLR